MEDVREAGSAPGRKRGRRALRVLGVGLALLLFNLALLPFLTRNGPDVRTPSVAWSAWPGGDRSDTLRIATLNLAHGRADGFHQLLLNAQQIGANLDSAAALLQRERPQLVALQEADGPSAWSGSFDHVRYFADQARLAYCVSGVHVEGLGLSYGTALASTLELREPLSQRFAGSWPTFSKGFVVAAVPWPGRPERLVDIVSLHLDFARGAVRASQVEELAAALRQRPVRPRIIAGDFNTDAQAGGALRTLCDALELEVWAPDSAQVTFPGLDARIDWIAVSPPLRIVRQRALPEVVSDHRAVVADIVWE